MKKLLAILLIACLSIGSAFGSVGSNLVVTEWTSFTMTIGAVTTPPTKGTVVTDVAHYKVVGKTLFIKYYYEQSVAGTGGTGEYLYPIPGGFTIDTAIAPVASASAEPRSIALGVARTQTSTTDGAGYVTVHDANNLKISVINGGVNTTLYQSNTTYSFIETNLVVSFSAEVPIT